MLPLSLWISLLLSLECAAKKQAVGLPKPRYVLPPRSRTRSRSPNAPRALLVPHDLSQRALEALVDVLAELGLGEGGLDRADEAAVGRVEDLAAAAGRSREQVSAGSREGRLEERRRRGTARRTTWPWRACRATARRGA